MAQPRKTGHRPDMTIIVDLDVKHQDKHTKSFFYRPSAARQWTLVFAFPYTCAFVFARSEGHNKPWIFAIAISNTIPRTISHLLNIFENQCNFSQKIKRIYGLVLDLNPGPLAPKARIIPLDQRAIYDR